MARRRARWPVAAIVLSLLATGLGMPGGALGQGSNPTGGRAVAVTFDDLPVISVTPLDARERRGITERLLTALTRQVIPATGFVNEYGLYGFAREPGGAPDPAGVALLTLWLDAGYDLANHGFAHADLHAVTLDAFILDIDRGEAVTRPLLEARGRAPRFFRNPYLHTGRDLETRRAVERHLTEHGYRPAPVTVDNEDWQFAAAYSRAAARGDTALMRRVAAAYVAYTERAFEYSERLSVRLFNRDIRQVLLLHANALNADHFEAIAAMMRRRGYRFVTLEEALRDAAYGSSDRYVGAESINWLGRWAITQGTRTEDNVLDDFPEVPGFVVAAATPPADR